MRNILRSLAVGVLLVSVLAVATSNKPAVAETLTDEQLYLIRANCITTKNTLNQLQTSDALLRVNRGQLYESMASKLMDRFNLRVTSNDQVATGLTVTTTSYRTALDGFRNDYKAYEEALAAVIKIDCQTQPSLFHDALEQARLKRAKVHTAINRLNAYIDDYQREVDIFATNFLKKQEADN